MNKNRLRLTDMIVTILISVVFAVVYRLWTPITDLVSLPGLQADQLLYGMWFIAGTIAALLIKKPGVALLAETAAASGEFFAGSPYGPLLLLYGVLQGLGIELAFALFKYRVYTVWTASLGAAFASFASLGFDYFNAYLSDLTTWNITLRIVFRTLGSIVIAGFLASVLVRALEKTGVSTLLRPVSQADYDLFASKRRKKDE
ncbi:thiamine ABC transporter permease [Shouchella clausii]|uniref:ECF transporter S component n=1 Tax=Shouchella tritolerans TaxID=2979466 RepID=UPI000786C739|nr:ECF transporter S component [Shouchella tritolerans]GIN10866.1 thiamine ABC transporter permease [Shouchella clausii]